MAIPLNKKLDDLFRRKVIEVNQAMSKRSSFIVVLPEQKTACNNCKWDPAHRASSGVYNGTGPKPFTGKVCPVCRGVGELKTSPQRKLDIANVRWSSPDKAGDDRNPHGNIPLGHARVKVLTTDRPLIEKAQYFIVDGVRCVLVGEIRNRGLLTHVMSEFLVKKDE